MPGKNIIRTMVNFQNEDLYGWIHKRKMIENSLNEANMVDKEWVIRGLISRVNVRILLFFINRKLL